MARFVYVAKRSLIAGHVVNNQYILDIDLQESEESDEDVKTSEQAIGGETETVYHRTDLMWQLKFVPVKGAQLLALREFLDSTVTGESFKAYIYGDETVGTLLRRLEEQHGEDPFMRVGSEDGDSFEATISAVETLDPTTLIDPYVEDPEAEEVIAITLLPDSLLAFSMNGTGARTYTLYDPWGGDSVESNEFLVVAVALQSLPSADLASFTATYGGAAMSVLAVSDAGFTPRRPIFLCTLANPNGGTGNDLVINATNISSTAARVVALVLFNVDSPASPPGVSIEALDVGGELVGDEQSVAVGGAVVAFGLVYTGGDVNPAIESETDDEEYEESVGAVIGGTGLDLVMGVRLFADSADEATRIVMPPSHSPADIENGAIGRAFTLEPTG